MATKIPEFEYEIQICSSNSFSPMERWFKTDTFVGTLPQATHYAYLVAEEHANRVESHGLRLTGFGGCFYTDNGTLVEYRAYRKAI